MLPYLMISYIFLRLFPFFSFFFPLFFILHIYLSAFQFTDFFFFFFFLSDKLLRRPASDFFHFCYCIFQIQNFHLVLILIFSIWWAIVIIPPFASLQNIYYTLNMFTVFSWLLCLLCLTSGPYLRQYLLPAFFPVYFTLFFFFFSSLSLSLSDRKLVL